MFQDSKLPVAPQITGGIASAVLPKLAAPAARQSMAIADDVAGKIPSVGPRPSVETAILAQKFQDIGGKVPLHSLSTNRFSRTAGAWMEDLPLSGSRKEANKVAFNKELLRQIGGDADKFDLVTPSSFSPALNRAGENIGKFYGKVDVPFNEGLGDAVSAISGRLTGEAGDTERIVAGHINTLLKRAEEHNGVIPGSVLRELDSEIGRRIRGTAAGDVKDVLRDLQEAIRDQVSARLSTADSAALTAERTKYAKAMQIEPLVAKGVNEGVTPGKLLGQVNSSAAGKHRIATGTAGELGDLAMIGNEFMRDISTSGMGERSLLLSLAAGGKAIPGLLVGQAYNRLGPVLSAINVRRALKKATPPAPEPLSLAPVGEPLVPPTPQGPVPQGRGLLNMADEGAMPGRAEPQMPSVEMPIEGRLQPMYQRGGIPEESGLSLIPKSDGLKMPEVQYPPAPEGRGLLSIADEQVAAIKNRGGAERTPVDFMGKTEFWQQKPMVEATEAFIQRAEELRSIINNKYPIDGRKQAAAAMELQALEKEFGAGAKLGGLRGKSDAYSALYQAGDTQLPIQKTFDPRITAAILGRK
jgi:hypothetical protein